MISIKGVLIISLTSSSASFKLESSYILGPFLFLLKAGVHKIRKRTPNFVPRIFYPIGMIVLIVLQINLSTHFLLVKKIRKSGIRC